VRLDPSFVDAWCNLGNGLKQAGLLEEAVVALQRCTALRPRHAMLHANLASLFHELRILPLAADTYRRAVELEPSFTDALNNLGNALKEMGQTDEAIACYRRAIELRPTHHHALNNLVRRSCFRFRCRRSAPRESLMAISSRARRISLCGWLPMALARLGRALFDQVLCPSPPQMPGAPSPAARRSAGGSPLTNNGMTILASTAYDSPQPPPCAVPFLLVPQGNALKLLGRRWEAHECYQAALRVDPCFAAAHSNLGALLKEIGGPPALQLALTHLAAAVRSNPSLAEPHVGMGDAYREAGLLVQAVRCYQTVLSIKPDMPEAHCHLGLAYKEQGRLTEAIVCFRRALSLRAWYPDALSSLVHSCQLICDWGEGDVQRESQLAQLLFCLRVELGDLPHAPHAASRAACPALQPFHTFICPFPQHLVLRLARAYAAHTEAIARALQPSPTCPSCSLPGGQGPASLLAHEAQDTASGADAPKCASAVAAPSGGAMHVRRIGSSAEAIPPADVLPAVDAALRGLEATLAPAARRAALSDPAAAPAAVYAVRATSEMPPMVVNESGCASRATRTGETGCPSSGELSSSADALRINAEPHKPTVPSAATSSAVSAGSDGGGSDNRRGGASARVPGTTSASGTCSCDAGAAGARTDASTGNGPATEHRLRVGYVSSDFGNHPLAHLMRSVFRFHARDRLEVFCYSLRPSDASDYRKAIEETAEHFREVRQRPGGGI